jgi:hypothetical protein
MAFGSSTVTDFGAGVSDLFAASADEAKAKMDIAEQQEYTLAGQLATQNEQYTQMSTAIKESQQNREITQALGKTQADVAGAGFAASGSALDILRSGAQQGAIAKATTSEQGLITEAGYTEQAASYKLMATAAGEAASEEETAAKGADISAGISFIASAATIPFGALFGGEAVAGGGKSGA